MRGAALVDPTRLSNYMTDSNNCGSDLYVRHVDKIQAELPQYYIDLQTIISE